MTGLPRSTRTGRYAREPEAAGSVGPGAFFREVRRLVIFGPQHYDGGRDTVALPGALGRLDRARDGHAVERDEYLQTIHGILLRDLDFRRR